MKSCINIYTTSNKVIIKIEQNALQSEIVLELNEKIKELKKMYKDDKTPILINGKVLKNKEMEEIQNIIKENIDVDIEFESPTTLGLSGIKKTFNKEIAISETKFHRGSLRSGQKLEFEGSLVIIGDVNGGAEILASDNIIVLGALRGMAHAGAKGNKDAIIAATAIESPQIRISNIIKEIERNEKNDKPKTYAYIDENGEVVIE